MSLANVIFPAPATFYVLGLLMPITILAALAVEWSIFTEREVDAGAKSKLLLVIIVANFWSWILGMLFTWSMPSGLVPRAIEEGKHSIITQGPNYRALAIMGLIIAYILSVGIEYYAIRMFYRRLKWRSLFRTTLLANSASYPVYICVAYVGAKFL